MFFQARTRYMQSEDKMKFAQLTTIHECDLACKRKPDFQIYKYALENVSRALSSTPFALVIEM